MSAHSLAGLFALNLLFLVAGAGILWALRGWSAWSELGRLAGLAYLLGVAAVGVEATLVLVAGAGVGVGVVLGLTLGTCLAGSLVGRLRGRRLPMRRRASVRGREPFLLLGAGAAALTVVFLGEFFRAARLQPLVAYDAWSFWTPKAKAIYFFGGLDEHLFRTLPGPSYPLLIPALQAMDFHFMGAADTVTLALQYWFLFAGFVAAAAGLLRPRVPLVLIWPFLGLAAVMPELDKRLLSPQADWPLDELFAVAALCLGVWLVTRERWLLPAWAVLLAAVMATKREGQLLAACLLVAALAASWRSRRSAWARLVPLAALAYAVNVPWRIWWTSRSLTPDTPDSGVGTWVGHLSRVLPSARIVLELVFSYDLWLVPVPLALAAAALALWRRGFALGSFYVLTTLLVAVGFTWILWSIPTLPLDTSQQTPIPRAVGALVLLAAAFAPLLLSRALGTADETQPDEPIAVDPV